MDKAAATHGKFLLGFSGCRWAETLRHFGIEADFTQKQPSVMRASNTIDQADQLMIRARASAESISSGIHIMKDRKIVEIRPEMADPRYENQNP